MNEKLKPPALRVVGKAPLAPVSIEERMAGVLPECFARIEAMDYAGAFQHFVQNLELIERTSGPSFFDEPMQKPLRKQLKQLWDSFLADIQDRKKLGTRLHALDEQTEKTLEEIKTASQDVRAKYDALSDDDRKYLRALVRQSIEKRTVVPFLNKASEEANFKREIESRIQDSIHSIQEPVEKAYAPKLKHMEYVGELFNAALPFLRRKMEGYVKSLVEGRRNYSDYNPVPAATIQANIVAFLEQAPKLAATFAELEAERFDANKSARNSLRK